MSISYGIAIALPNAPTVLDSMIHSCNTHHLYTPCNVLRQRWIRTVH